MHSAAETPGASGGSQPWQRLLQARELGIGGLLLLLAIFMTFRNDAFLTPGNVLDIGMDSSVLVLIAMHLLI